MALTYAIEVGSLALNDNVADTNGAYWYVESFDGWESPEVRITTIALTGSAGAAVGEAFYGPLSVVVEGDCVAPSIAAMWASQARLRAAVTPDPAVWLIVHESPTAQKVPVRLASALRVRLHRAGVGFHFQIPLIAPNPTKVPA